MGRVQKLQVFIFRNIGLKWFTDFFITHKTANDVIV